MRQISWILWCGGSALILGSWVRIVPSSVGWVGFVIAGIGSLISYIPSVDDPSLTHEGVGAVEPSGTPIPDEMRLVPGTPLLAYSAGRWWEAIVVSMEKDGIVEVSSTSGGHPWTIPSHRRSLQIDLNRTPITLPEGSLSKWGNELTAGDERTMKLPDGVQE